MTDWSDTPAGRINRLDVSLARIGEDVILRRTLGTQQVPIDATVRAHVRGYKADELIAGSGIVQGDSAVIISPTDIDRAQWPGAQAITSPPSTIDPRVPKKGDKMVIQGKTRNIEAAAPVYLDGVLIRIYLQVKG